MLPSIKDHAESVVSDEAFEKRAERWPDSTPDTKEAYFIRDVFDSACPLLRSRHRPLSTDLVIRAPRDILLLQACSLRRRPRLQSGAFL